MATVRPAFPTHAPRSPGEAAELALLRELADRLSDAYVLFHGVDWSQGSGMQERHGEVDVVVMNQAGELMLLEVKAGAVSTGPEGLFKQYGGQRKDVSAQIRHQYNAFRSRLQTAGLAEVTVRTLLVLPDHRVSGEGIGWPRERIVDADEIDGLPRRVTSDLGPGLPQPERAARVATFLENRFQVAPDVSALVRRAGETSTRLAEGLATWVPRIESPSGLIRVHATAGSGKTQLALRLLRDAAAAGQRAAYLCFNRPLADHMGRLLPAAVPAETFHEYAIRLARAGGLPVDFQRPGVFEEVAAWSLRRVAECAPDLDLLVIDEVQDFQADWIEGLLCRLRGAARAVLLEDPAQQLYEDREPFDLEGAVTVRCMENFRSPRRVVELVNLLGLGDAPVDARSAWVGETPDPIVWSSVPAGPGGGDGKGDAAAQRALHDATVQAVQRCLDAGHALADIVVLSPRGRGSSWLQRQDRLGPWTVARFTGEHDAGGAPVWTEGELVVESVRRFKGQAAPAVVLSECDFDALDTITRRLLFVGLTRARVRVEWVLSERAAGVVAKQLG